MNGKLELQLRKVIWKNKLIWGLVGLAGILLLEIFAPMVETSDSLIPLLLAPTSIFLITFGISFFVASFFCRFESTRSGGDLITVYRGMSNNILYINGVEKDRTSLLNHSYYLETRLSDGSTVTVALARGRAFRLTFSNGQPPVEF